MKYCKKCGKELFDEAVVCPNCGVAQDNYNSGAGAGAAADDAKSMGFAVLCFFFPVVGLILYLVWRNQYPLKASSCGKGALIGVIVNFVIGICSGILMATVLKDAFNNLQMFLPLIIK